MSVTENGNGQQLTFLDALARPPEPQPGAEARQYALIKSEVGDDVILLVGRGEYHEAYLEDAHTAAPIMGVGITMRDGMPVCRIPSHELDRYLAKLIRARKRTAVCEDMGESENACARNENPVS